MRPGLKISSAAIIILFFTVMTSLSAPEKGARPKITEKRAGSITLVYIPAGSFRMGRDVKESDHSPSRPVRITKGYWIGKYEITQKQYRDVTEDTPCAGSRYGEGDELPVFNVSWYEAVEFCNALSLKHGLKPYYIISKDMPEPMNVSPFDEFRWRVTVDRDADGFRLPTEAEWEYACMGTKLSDFYWGDNCSWEGSGAYAWHMFNAGQRSYSKGRFWWVKYHRVKKPGQKKCNAFGLYDMSGNVGEWCYDRYAGSYPQAERDDPEVDDIEFRYRVARGGSLLDAPRDLAGYKRWPAGPFEKTGTNGIRVVLPE